MSGYANARAAVIGLLPELKGWKVYTDGIATGAKPPWIVVSMSEDGRQVSEGGHTTNHLGKLDIRVVSLSELGIGIVCDRLTAALDGAHADGVSALIPDVDSGVYASELVDTDTSTPYLMRVLTWRIGWPA